ncbi:hypothetical protein [Embleya scabrispora]|uniref:hypothetical protein n=1 Tax=Embleya scabrispora TaxID=159449 RepID=UPI00036D30D7|nr:hypothetical protein [Embleya scabrispora]MYS85119.1 hypothetical protein [Streptomyces sp. SID5474]
MDRAGVRRVACALRLPCADKPAAPCPASRLAHFDPVEPGKLRQIEQAEDALPELGFAEPRVRRHGDVARVEPVLGELARASGGARLAVLGAGRSTGFRFVALDPAGVRSGAFTLPSVPARI